MGEGCEGAGEDEAVGEEVRGGPLQGRVGRW